jgi:hypothetical protein
MACIICCIAPTKQPVIQASFGLGTTTTRTDVLVLGLYEPQLAADALERPANVKLPRGSSRRWPPLGAWSLSLNHL